MSSIVQHNVQTGTSSPLSHAQPCTTLLGMLLPGAGVVVGRRLFETDVWKILGLKR